MNNPVPQFGIPYIGMRNCGTDVTDGEPADYDRQCDGTGATFMTNLELT